MQPSSAAITEYNRAVSNMAAEQANDDLSRSAVTKRIKAALVKRSGVQWSVAGGDGTAYGWITITAPKSRRLNGGSCMTDADRVELGKLLGIGTAHHQGVNIASSYDYYREYIDRAEGRAPPRKIAEPYWD